MRVNRLICLLELATMLLLPATLLAGNKQIFHHTIYIRNTPANTTRASIANTIIDTMEQFESFQNSCIDIEKPNDAAGGSINAAKIKLLSHKPIPSDLLKQVNDTICNDDESCSITSRISNRKSGDKSVLSLVQDNDPYIKYVNLQNFKQALPAFNASCFKGEQEWKQSKNYQRYANLLPLMERASLNKNAPTPIIPKSTTILTIDSLDNAFAQAIAKYRILEIRNSGLFYRF